ncbi:hypothetical protein CGCSCA5_v007576 [Colletotrichum siamense]|nr:hypothetical protein CGCSCA5_v007576 [Colletotrichum siamense]KAF4870280.1 hypothetical protein CGCSCA1_v010513 [Colletotrichum siamense]
MSHASSEVYEPPVVLCAGNWRITRRRHSTHSTTLPTIQSTYQWRRETDGTSHSEMFTLHLVVAAGAGAGAGARLNTRRMEAADMDVVSSVRIAMRRSI